MFARRFTIVLLLSIFLLLPPGWVDAGPSTSLAPVAPIQVGDPDGAGRLTLLHNNDGESSLLPLTNSVATNGTTVELPVGGVAAFKTLTEQQIEEARSLGHAVLNVYAGDAFLASGTLVCSQDPEQPLYDAVAQRQIPYDAHILGNHEFDYTPDFLEKFIRAFEIDGALTQPFLSANLDFSEEPGFADLIDADGLIEIPITDGRVIGRYMVITDPETGQRFGIVGATTWTLPIISSPRRVRVTSTDLASTAEIVQTHIDHLYNDLGVRKIIFVSHLQSVENDRALIQLLRHIDVAVAGGGDELLENPAIDNDLELLPGESAPIQGTYPLQETDADGRTVYIVTTAGNYKYLGRLDVEFDETGEVAQILSDTSYARRVIPTSPAAEELGLPDAVTPDPDITNSVITPLKACLDALSTTRVATTEVLLDVSRAGVRTRESNAGNMIADSFIYAYDQRAESLGLPPRGDDNRVIAVTNGGGIRQNAGDVLPRSGVVPGDITRLDTLDVLPFPNFVTVVSEVTPADLKTVFERSASRLPDAGGQFLQVSGVQVTYNIANPVGSRVVSLSLADGTPIIQNGEVVADAPLVRVVTNSFVAAGGDGYETFANNPNQVQLGMSYEQAWREYMQSFPDQTIRADDPRYQPGGEGRIVIQTPEPTPTPTPVPVAPPAGNYSLTARVFLDNRCDSFFQRGLDIPLDDVLVTLHFPNGAVIERRTRPLFGVVNFSGFDVPEQVIVRVHMPESYKGYTLGQCPGNPDNFKLEAEDFQFRYKFVQFRAQILGEQASP